MNLNDFLIYDLETPEYCFLASFYNVTEDKFYDFPINKFENTLYKLINFIEKNIDFTFVGYNNLKFDNQVLNYILKNYENWYNLSNIEVSKKISKFASNEIENSNYNIQPTYSEKEIPFNFLDLPCIWHFFNENKRVSLKQLEFEMRSENIENLEFELDKDFTYEEIYGKNGIIDYCHNDVINTFKFFEITLGNTEKKLYKGKNKISDRKAMFEEFGLNCWNWDDVKIGAEWNKKDYLEKTKAKKEDLKPKKIIHYYGKKFGTFFPKTVSFENPELKKFLNDLSNHYILKPKKGKKKQEFKFKFNKELTSTIALGGIHSNEKGRFLKPKSNELYIQLDIGSQYPNALRKYKVEPPHLKGWNNLIISKIERRLNYKKLFQETKDPKFGSLQEMGKLSLNGGMFGRLNTKNDWQEYPFGLAQVTIGCQLEILMTTEILLKNNIRVVSQNTDGLDVIIEKEKLDLLFDLIEKIEKQIGNFELGNFEYTVFEWIAQTSVNDYIAKKIGNFVNRQYKESTPEYKLKGDFEIDKELHKNSSFTIFPLAYFNYFANNIPVEEFINNHNDIYDFFARSNSGSN